MRIKTIELINASGEKRIVPEHWTAQIEHWRAAGFLGANEARPEPKPEPKPKAKRSRRNTDEDTDTPVETLNPEQN